MQSNVDISENKILELDRKTLENLLFDHTTCKNIMWCTDDYKSLGEGYQATDTIEVESITGKHGLLIRPRAIKSLEEQKNRTQGMAEVFTPSWVCNAQNNLIDEQWFGRTDVFNTEITDPDGSHRWETTNDKIIFPEGKTWKDYVGDTRLEITCGEAPYLTSRYDTTTGGYIPVADRIGIIDRKLRVISENVDNSTEWLKAAQRAYKNTYGYELQGDNLLLAREALLCTFIDFYQEKFDKMPLVRSIQYIAYIISWNIWQMDGLKCVVPMSCHEDTYIDLFGGETKTPCPGCKSDNIRSHNGTYCLIKDWGAIDKDTGTKGKKMRFVDLIKS